MRNVVPFCLLLASCLSTAAAFAQQPSAQIGINLAGPADWNTELPFVDVFRMSRSWISQRQGAAWGQGPKLETDELGWVKRLEAGCYAETMLCTIRDGHFPGGVYTVLYEGDGDLDFAKSATVVANKPGEVRIDVDATRGGFSLQIRRTNPSDYVRNIRVIMPGFENTWQQNPFHPTFLRRWQGMACVRFMDWMHTNGSEIKTWADRPTLDHATFSKHGVAAEWMIDLCNRIDVDPWFCMPHLADDDFVRRFATLVRDRLEPSRKVYIEYSNEVWNGQFAQSRYAGEQGVKLGLGPAERPWEAGWHYTAVRSLEIFAIWEEVFGGHQRLVRVLPSQAANPYVSEQILAFRDAYKHADALAVAPYMSCTVGRGKLTNVEEIAAWNTDQLLDYFEQTSLSEAIDRMQQSKAVADKYDVQLIAYEAGQHMVALTSSRELTDRLTQTMHAANRHPRMGDIYDRYYAAWVDNGGGLLAHFSSVGGWSNHGSWGLLQYYDDNATDYPKFATTMRWAKKLGRNVRVDDHR